MNNGCKGTCLIISNENFPFEIKADKYDDALKVEFKKRDGTEKDVHDLKQLFTEFGFDVVIRKDLIAAVNLYVLKSLLKNNFNN